MTRDEVKKLLEEAHQGPYYLEGRAGQLELADITGLIFGLVHYSPGLNSKDIGTAQFLLAAPEIATFALAESERADQAEAAMAAVVEQVAFKMSEIMADSLNVPISHDELVDTLDHNIRNLAPASGLAILEELRGGEIQELRAAKWKEQHVDTMNDMVSLGIERDTLATENAALKEKLQTVTEDIKFIKNTVSLSSAQATAEKLLRMLQIDT